MTQFSKKIRLTNGLSVIFEKNDNAKIVSLYIGIRAGSVHESDAESGLCHLIEHMVFKGTKSYEPGEIATLVESHGGELNAFTSLDQTVYFINLPSQHFRLGLKLLKEMVFDATMDPEELEREKEVILEEIRRGKDSPQRVLGEALFKSCFKKHHYGRPVIGTANHVRGFTPQKVKSFYKKHYKPQNMILGVCGNISEAQLSHALEDLFRFEVSPPAMGHSIPKEPPFQRYQIIRKTMKINATYFDLAFQAPNLNHEDVPALDIMSNLLGESDTSLLEQNTKEKEHLVHHVSCSCYTPKFPGLFIISGMVDPRLLNKALESVKKQIHFMQTRLMDAERIERAKLMARSQLIYEQQTCEGTAKKWIIYETTAGDYRYDEKYINEVQRLTAHDIQKVAQTYLNINKSKLVILHPDDIKVDVNKSLYKTANTLTKKKFKKQSQLKDTAIYKLDNGIRVILKENHRLPLVSIKTASLAGLRYETKNNNGINHIISNLITKSTKNFSQVALAEKNEWLAGKLGGYTGRNSQGLSFSFLSERIRDALSLLTDIILNPSFDPKETKYEKRLQLEAIKNRADNAAQVCVHMVLKKLFHGHPYRYHLLGETSSVKDFNDNNLRKYYNSILCAKNMVIAVVGDFETEEMLDRLNQSFASVKQKSFTPKKLKRPTPPKSTLKLTEKSHKEQAHVAIGFLGANLYDKDRYALEIINNILSGQGGRLFLELRDKQSLAYTVTSTMIEGIETGFFGTYIGTEPAKVNTALEGMICELEKIQKQPVSKDELDRAKNFIIGNHEIDHQTNGTIGMQLVLNELYGKKLSDFFDFQKQIAKVTRQDILKTARKYIKLDRCVIGVVGPK